jgi:hypothetical protein
MLDRQSPSTGPGRLPAYVTAVSLFLAIASPIAVSQGPYDLHSRVVGHTYSDTRISAQVPDDWTVAIDRVYAGPGRLFVRSAVLRHGQDILRLCTACKQASGIVGGRYNEIVWMVQPWFRSDPAVKPSPCGKQETTSVSKLLVRRDFRFRHVPGRVYSDDYDDCGVSKTDATVWYGSYFAERGPKPIRSGEACGGPFLDLGWLTHEKPDSDEMAFALTADAAGPDGMPPRNEPELRRVLREASAIVASVRYRPSGGQ